MSYCDSPADFAKYLLYIIVTTEIGILVAGGQPVKREAFAANRRVSGTTLSHRPDLGEVQK